MKKPGFSPPVTKILTDKKTTFQNVFNAFEINAHEKPGFFAPGHENIDR
ncbi:Uncharacterized protein dnm_074830 [Desulfonema magnum]|uniref:Uncharacterized protein n=1 Tax=Desulfonema magnum TaxID=45655 RepID=A0A975BTL3_9BACT|nr:Uncharacterized protein dnm_074830 [Desulfonema magnum]